MKSETGEIRNYSSIYRIIHWAIAICMLLILLTIFLRLTWMNRDHVAEIIQNYFSENGKELSRDDATKLARQIRKPMWQWHIYLGYVLTGLYSIRMLLPFITKSMKFSSPFKSGLTLKVKFQYWVYIVFYICVGVSLTTGLFIEFGPEKFKETMEEIHVLSIYYLVTFIILHFGGVLLAEFSDQKGIVSRIVSGSAGKKSDS